MDGATVGIGETAFAAYLLALSRTAGFVLITPPFNTRSVPARARVGLAVALALPLSATQVATPTLGSASLYLRALAEAFTGLSLGFFVLLAVAAVQSVGELLDVVGGFTMSTAMDPLLMAQTSVMGRLHQLTAVTLLFASDGHLVVLRGLSRTMGTAGTAVPNSATMAEAVTTDVAGLFTSAIQIAAPVIAAMLVADVALGLLTRAAPALNPFALSFPLKIGFTLLLAGLIIARLPQVVHTRVDHAVLTVVDLVHAAGGG
ncbi:MAG: flagellar biosynthetic protein FliR [Kineosporiaceae bacterium]|nr:flagellar biosynthetic protein FliR [Kineosporiaceae bacterium]